MRHFAFRLLPLVCVACLGAGPGAAVEAATEGEYRYAAVLPGDCETFVVGNRDLTARCTPELVNVDFGDGRVTFVVGSDPCPDCAVTAFTGGSSHQASLHSYVLDVDHLVTSSGPDGRTVEKPAIGRCTMTGDPLQERALFACWAESEDGISRMEFRTRGTPAVSYGKAGS